MVTIKDVARTAGVSAPTVSRVLANKDTVDPQLRTRVLDAVQHLNYRPHRGARALRRRVTHTFAFIVPDIQNPFFTSVLRGLEDRAFLQDYVVVLCNTDDSLQRQQEYIDVLRAEGAAGIAICTASETATTAEIDLLRSQGIAVVAVDRIIAGSDVDTVVTDNVQGAQAAVAHLLQAGHRRIGLVAGPDYFAPGRERRQGYEDAYRVAGLDPDGALVKVTDFRPESAAQMTRELLSLPADRRPTALFACSSRLALAALGAIAEFGLRIPADVAFISFDDADWAVNYAPRVTAVAQPTYQIGASVCDLLLRRLANPDAPPQTIRLAPQLILRQSCCRH